MKRSNKQSEINSLMAWAVMVVMFLSLMITIQLSQRNQDNRNFAKESQGNPEIVLPEIGGPQAE